ncbi:MAG: iron-sulfur cluster-binding domain-containing protein [Chitinophagales bacterium]
MSYTEQNKITREINKTLFNTSAANYFAPIIDAFFPNNSLGCIKAKVINIIQERDDVISIELKPNRKFNAFIPGQYVETTIKINAVNYNRIFSISSSLQQLNQDNIIVLTIQKQKDGKVTSWIHQNLKKGDTIEISQAMGDFTLPETNHDVLFIAGGSGITPFRSMLYQALEKEMNVTLLYYCNTLNEHLFEDELNAFKNDNINVIFIDSNNKGFINENHIKEYCSDFANRKTFICGPAPMITAAQNVLAQLGVDESNIIIERFRPIQLPTQDLAHIKGTVSVLKLNKNNIEVNSENNILETLEQNGVFPKHGCRMGICKKCQCTKKSGMVYDKLNQKYSQTNEEKITICTTIPVGEVEIEF